MAKVRCPCGRQYAISDEHVGRRVKCRACGKSFIARPIDDQPPAGPARPGQRAARQPIGDRAIARGYITRAQLDACLEYQMALNDASGTDDRRLGRLLVAGGLLTAQQLQALLGVPQRETAPAQGEPPGPDHPIGEQQREALRRTVEAAARKQAERKKVTTRMLPIPAPLLRLRLTHLVLVLVLALGALIVWRMRPPPEPARVLATYLESCSVEALAPDSRLALRDLAIDVGRIGPVRLGSPTTHDYAAELQTFADGKRGKTWYHLIQLLDMPDDKRRALWLAAPAFPDSLAPRDAAQLAITVLPATVALDLKPRGIGSFREARCRFLLVSARSGDWQLGWRVGSYEQLAADGADSP